MNPVETLLEQKGWVLADGATATNLFNLGLESGHPPELWNETHPEKITNLYESSIDAGSEIILTNSFGGNRPRLKLHKVAEKSFELNQRSADIGREIIDKKNLPILLAGSMGPTGEIMAPLGELTHSLAVEFFHEQTEGLKEGGVDVLWIETMSSREEFIAAQEACKLAGLPWCGTMSFDTAGRTMMGISPEELAEIVSDFDNPPIGFGANCGLGASDSIFTILQIAKVESTIPIIAKGNAGIPKFVKGEIQYEGSPQVMGDYARLARDCGAKIIGGCCGTTPEHLKAMRDTLESSEIQPAPNMNEIIKLLGDPVFHPDKSSATRQRIGRRRKKL